MPKNVADQTQWAEDISSTPRIVPLRRTKFEDTRPGVCVPEAEPIQSVEKAHPWIWAIYALGFLGAIWVSWVFAS